MGLSKKSQVDSSLEPENMRWVIAGIAVRTSIKPVNTKTRGKEDDVDSDDECSTTPTAKEARILKSLPCPPAPRKQRPAPSCHYNGAREFFRPPDLETVFKCYVKKAD